MTALLGWIGNVLFIYGVYAVGNKNIYGFFCNAIANVLYILNADMTHNAPLYVLSIGLAILNIIGMIKWNKGVKDVKI